MLHGGDYVSGDKCDADPAAAAVLLAQHGYVAFTLNYPLATAAQPTFPNPVYDVMDGVANLEANAATFGVDPTRDRPVGRRQRGQPGPDAAAAAPRWSNRRGRVTAVVDDSGTTDIFERQGEYTALGTADPGDHWATYLGCANPVSIPWNPTANTCFTTYQQASPALLTDPLGGTLRSASGAVERGLEPVRRLGHVRADAAPPGRGDAVAGRRRSAGPRR